MLMARSFEDVETQISEVFNVAVVNLGETAARQIFAGYGSRSAIRYQPGDGGKMIPEPTVNAVSTPPAPEPGLVHFTGPDGVAKTWIPGVGWTIDEPKP
jgi:hypothetical protein